MYRVLASFRKTRLFILVFCSKNLRLERKTTKTAVKWKATLFIFSAWVITLEKS